jgi:hypothetical protein
VNVAVADAEPPTQRRIPTSTVAGIAIVVAGATGLQASPYVEMNSEKSKPERTILSRRCSAMRQSGTNRDSVHRGVGAVPRRSVSAS